MKFAHIPGVVRQLLALTGSVRIRNTSEEDGPVECLLDEWGSLVHPNPRKGKGMPSLPENFSELDEVEDWARDVVKVGDNADQATVYGPILTWSEENGRLQIAVGPEWVIVSWSCTSWSANIHGRCLAQLIEFADQLEVVEG